MEEVAVDAVVVVDDAADVVAVDVVDVVAVDGGLGAGGQMRSATRS